MNTLSSREARINAGNGQWPDWTIIHPTVSAFCLQPEKCRNGEGKFTELATHVTGHVSDHW